jgi:transcriptional regulator with XRE-family HTH domain
MGMTPNTVLQAWRKAHRWSQDEMAEELRAKGASGITKRTIQRWENGEITNPQGKYARALQALTGLPIEMLGFPAGVDAMVVDDGRGGHDLEVRAPSPLPAGGGSPGGNLSGIWLSRYGYFSSSRGQALEGLHYAIVLQHGDRLTVRSIPGSANSTMTMDLTVDRNIVTGTWVEDTDPGGYYKAARYHGAIQLLVEPTGRRMTGKWIGFGKDYDINTGPWTLTFMEASTGKAALERYGKSPEE